MGFVIEPFFFTANNLSDNETPYYIAVYFFLNLLHSASQTSIGFVKCIYRPSSAIYKYIYIYIYYTPPYVYGDCYVLMGSVPGYYTLSKTFMPKLVYRLNSYCTLMFAKYAYAYSVISVENFKVSCGM